MVRIGRILLAALTPTMFLGGLVAGAAVVAANDNFAPQVQSAAQQRSFDGFCVAYGATGRKECRETRLALEVRGNAIHGIVVSSSGRFPIVGWLGPAGEGNWISAQKTAFWIGIHVVHMSGTIRFSRDFFATDYVDACGRRHASGARYGTVLKLLNEDTKTEAKEAMAYLETGRAKGKVVLAMR